MERAKYASYDTCPLQTERARPRRSDFASSLVSTTSLGGRSALGLPAPDNVIDDDEDWTGREV